MPNKSKTLSLQPSQSNYKMNNKEKRTIGQSKTHVNL